MRHEPEPETGGARTTALKKPVKQSESMLAGIILFLVLILLIFFIVRSEEEGKS